MKIMHLVGARPNFMKAAPVISALRQYPFMKQLLVHTGQHYTTNMSQIFFEQLGMPKPNINLEVGSSSHAVQTAEIMMRFEKVILQENPSLLLVYGDVNSTIAAALVAAKMGILVGHVEAGLRSYDRTMPEEINRVLTDQISDFFFTHSADADANLQREGVPSEKIFMVGNVMIDTLVHLLEKAVPPDIAELEKPYILATLHRPSNVDEPAMLSKIMDTFNELSERIKIIFPIHPRTRKRIKESGLSLRDDGRFILEEPLGYLEFLWLQQHAQIIITDSGGIQEESTYLQVPCLTLRKNTERPITCEIGTNQLVGEDTEGLKLEAEKILQGHRRPGSIPPLWDGRAGKRIAEIIRENL